MSMQLLMNASDLTQGIRRRMEIKAGKSGSAGDGIRRVTVAVGQCGGEVVAKEGIEEIIRCDRDGER